MVEHVILWSVAAWVLSLTHSLTHCSVHSHTILLQMRHVELAKEEGLPDAIRGWYSNTKARHAEYTQQLSQLEEAVGEVIDGSTAGPSSPQEASQLAAPLVGFSCHLSRLELLL